MKKSSAEPQAGSTSGSKAPKILVAMLLAHVRESTETPVQGSNRDQQCISTPAPTYRD